MAGMPALLLVSVLTCYNVLMKQAPAPAPHPPMPAHSAVSVMYVPERVFETRRKSFADFEAMLADVARADVILVGEQHDDSNTHRLEAALLQGLLRRRVPVVVSLEMFERDVQPVLDAYLAGTVTEQDFLGRARPWPRYATDYRGLIEMAKAHRWPVIAANVPRRLAVDVSKQGLGTLDALTAADRAYAARDLQCPKDAYFDRFVAAVAGHPAPGAEKASEADRASGNERMYHSQCLKDETMAESIAAAFDARQGRSGTIVHYTGAFHSDFGAGTAERVRRRLPGRRVAVVSVIPVDDLDSVEPTGEDITRAEYLVYTVK
jgi:uncharacterized iron-regulated protein